MTVQPEYPHGRRGERWPGNGDVYERNRVECLEIAERMRREGNVAGAERFEAQAAGWKASRDEELRREDMRRINSRAHRRPLF